jgi:hypothetical protein
MNWKRIYKNEHYDVYYNIVKEIYNLYPKDLNPLNSSGGYKELISILKMKNLSLADFEKAEYEIYYKFFMANVGINSYSKCYDLEQLKINRDIFLECTGLLQEGFKFSDFEIITICEEIGK